MSKLSETAARAVEAYGGEDLWRKAKSARVTVSARGLAFRIKRRPPFSKVTLTCDVHRPYVRLSRVGLREGVTGVLDGGDVRLEREAEAEDVLERRENARSYFPAGRRLVVWDDMDIAYFAGYAFWNYITLPALLMNENIRWEERAPGWLRGHFPSSIPTHCPVQDFFFDDTGLLKQHLYTVEILGRLAKAANTIGAHGTANGIPFTSFRQVAPQGLGSKPLPWPNLLNIEMADFRIET